MLLADRYLDYAVPALGYGRGGGDDGPVQFSGIMPPLVLRRALIIPWGAAAWANIPYWAFVLVMLHAPVRP